VLLDGVLHDLRAASFVFAPIGAEPTEQELKEGQHPNNERVGGTVQRIARKFDHDRALREFTENGGYLSGLGGRGFHIPRGDE
jgi:hypothetical protein